jgi:hypothetical protein
MVNRDLTAQQQLFVTCRMHGLSPVEAYRQAYPQRGSGRRRQTERSSAYRLGKTAHVQKALERERRQAQREDEESCSPKRAWRHYRRLQAELERRLRAALSNEAKTEMVFENLAPPFVEPPVVSVAAAVQERLDDLRRQQAPAENSVTEELRTLVPVARAAAPPERPRPEPAPAPEGPVASILSLRGESPRPSADVPRYRRELRPVPGQHPPRWRYQLILDDSPEKEASYET